MEGGAKDGRAAEHDNVVTGFLVIIVIWAGGIEPSPLVVKDGGLMLPLSPSPGHWTQSIDVLPQAGVECLLKVMD